MKTVRSIGCFLVAFALSAAHAMGTVTSANAFSGPWGTAGAVAFGNHGSIGFGASNTADGPIDIVITGLFDQDDHIGFFSASSGSGQIGNASDHIFGNFEFEVGHGVGATFGRSGPGDGLGIGSVGGHSTWRDGTRTLVSEDYAVWTGGGVPPIAWHIDLNEFNGQFLLNGAIVVPTGETSVTIRITPSIPGPGGAMSVAALSLTMNLRRRRQ